MSINFPFHFDNHGRTSVTNDGIRNMIEQLLFTNPGERLNRPDFGSGLSQMVFGANSPEQAAALKFTLQATIQRWMGDLIEVQGLDVTSQDSSLTVFIRYVVRRTNTPQTAQFKQNM